MTPIYCISGIGADERIFDNLQIRNHSIVPIHWPAFDKHEDIRSYARKISDLIPEKKPIILGLSYGGMLAVEIGKIRDTEKIFLVSSAKNTAELPKISRMFNADKMLDMAPDFLFKSARFANFKMIGAKNKEEEKLLAAMLKDSAPGFVKWALKAVVLWKNTDYPTNVIHLHGTADNIIPAANVKPDYWVEGGSHIMVYNRSADVNRIISGCLEG